MSQLTKELGRAIAALQTGISSATPAERKQLIQDIKVKIEETKHIPSEYHKDLPIFDDYRRFYVKFLRDTILFIELVDDLGSTLNGGEG